MYEPKNDEERELLAEIYAKLRGASIVNLTSLLPSNLLSPDYVPPNKGDLVLILTIVTMIVMLAMVVLRLYARWKYAGSLGLDDWMIIPAAVVTVGFSIVQILGMSSIIPMKTSTLRDILM